MNSREAFLVCAAGLLCTSCTVDGHPPDGDWVGTIASVGDTLVVTSSEGSVWAQPMALHEELRIGQVDGADEYVFGDIIAVAVDSRGRVLALDRLSKNVRIFDGSGLHVATAGGPGEGPGELTSPGGIVIRRDDSFVVHDRAKRVSIFNPDGTYRTSIPKSDGFMTDNRIVGDSMGNAYIWIYANPEAASISQGVGRLRVRADNTFGDTILPPPAQFSGPFASVPFAPGQVWTIGIGGERIIGRGPAYRILVEDDEQPLVIEKEHSPVRIGAAEKEWVTANTFMSVSMNGVTKRWEGEGMPDTKPAFRDLLPGRDGTLWVDVYSPGVSTTNSQGNLVWNEPRSWDVFAQDGKFLGNISRPDGFTPHVVDEEVAWGVLRGELGVPYVVKYRIGPAI